MLPILLSLIPSPAQDLAAAPPAEPTPTGTRLLDLDGDGQRDLLTFHADGTLLVRQGAGPRCFLDVPQELPRVQVTDLVCSDLDGDGELDLYLVSPAADVALLGLGGGRFREATEELGLVEAGLGRSAERLDLDGDGLEDLLVHNAGSDVLFWARPDGRFEREERTLDGVAPTGVAPTLVVPIALPTELASPGSIAGPVSSTVSSGASALTTGPLAGATSPSSPASIIAFPSNADARYVNDNQNEVDSADIVDGSLTGADVSTSGGNVTFGGGATVTAEQGVFGNVGIGTTTPGAPLHVAGTTSGTPVNGNARAVIDSDGITGLQISAPDDEYTEILFGGPTIGNASGRITYNRLDIGLPEGFDFSTNGGNPEMVITSAGNVGIGTTTPSSPLEINAPSFFLPLKITGGNNPGIRIDNTVGGAPSSWGIFHGLEDALKFMDLEANAVRLAIAGDTGNVGIGTTTPTFKLEVNGSAGISGDVTQGLASDGLVKAACHIDGRGTIAVTRSFNNLPGGTTITANQALDSAGNPVTGFFDVHFGADISDRFYSATLGMPVYQPVGVPGPPIRGGIDVSQVGGLDSMLLIRCYDKDGILVNNEFWLMIY